MEGVKIHYLSRVAEEGFVTVDGYRVPFLKVNRTVGGASDGSMGLTLCRPGGSVFVTIDVVDDDSLHGFLWFVANCMAVAAGYSCFGENSQPFNPYRQQCHIITQASSDDDAIS